MKYLIVGAGGMGGCLSGFLAQNGHETAILARGAHKEAIEKDGLRVRSGLKGEFTVHPKVYGSGDTPEKYDVIFVTVKGYSIEEVIPFIDAASDENTAIIPLLNIITTGDKLQAALPDKMIVDGVVYVIAQIIEPGLVSQLGSVFKMLIGTPAGRRGNPGLAKQIAADIAACGIVSGVSEDIKKDEFLKFSSIASMAGTNIYYDVPAGEIQKITPSRVLYAEFSREVQAMARAKGVIIEGDLAENNLKHISAFDPKATASTYRDYKAGRKSEIDGIFFDVVRESRALGFEAPAFALVAEKLGFRE